MIRSTCPLVGLLVASPLLVFSAVSVASPAEPFSLAAQNGPVTVEATARGPSAAEARKAAIVAALRKVVGEYVEADVVIANDEVVKDEILSFSNAGGVESEQVGEPKLVGDEVEVTMRVTVEPKPLVARVKGAAKAGAKLDGAALAAEIAAAKDDYKAKTRVLEKAFAELPDAFMTIRIVDSEGNDTTGIDRELVEIDRGTGNATITIPIVLGFDKGVWRNVVHPALDQVLTAAADRKVVDGVVVRRKGTTQGRSSKGKKVSPDYTFGSPTMAADLERESFVALLREDLGRGRQLNYDAYIFDDFDQLPLTVDSGRRAVGALPPRSLRIRLLDADGVALDGRDFVVGERFETIVPIFKAQGFRAFAWGGRMSGQRSFAMLAPKWLGANSPTIWTFADSVVFNQSFEMPEDDLELIEKIEVELIRPGG